MDMRLAGKSVLITGASQGIGAGLAHAFAGEGCALVLVARSHEKLQALRAELLARHDVGIEVQAMDLTRLDSAEQLAASYGAVDILVNNAGGIPGGDLWSVDAQRWRAGWELKVMGYVDVTRAFYRRMRERGHGVILNNIGSGGENYDFDYIAGTAGYAALMAFTRALGGKSLRDGIRVVGVNPGPVATARIETLMRGRARELYGDAERYTELLARLPLGRAASVQEVADLFVFLASPRSAYTSGVIVTIDGGMTSNKSIT
ncbi:SDR family oxidoreductase [Bordetella bronchiseptica]|uniref:SDR family oxidoreductase n=1 Tax=Bordetella bronchiseptica TaxID=518 RepID=UPI0004A19A7D|nr:SDR family oxidoreductase [Bordetella bronchiseptica]KDB57718.1 KR domain protein [Bordetella bronchiseptica A1-7]KDB72117.1 KR domain protein [Bordetella bronchiseptica B20-10725633]